MEHSQFLGKSTLSVPRLGLGAMIWGQPSGLARWTPAQLAYGPSDGREEEERALDMSLAAGVNLIDTAAMYSNGASERRVGELASGRDMLIATKFPPSMRSNTDALPGALESSLARLGRTCIDLYQIHFPSRRFSIPRLMNHMADAVEAGKVKAVGVSNFSAAEMRLAHAELTKRGIPLASNQVQYSLVHRTPEVDGVLEACQELGITLIAYSPLGMGALTGKYSRQNRASGLRRMMPSFSGRALNELEPLLKLLAEIGSRYGKTPSQVALRWLVENPSVLPIPGAKNGRQAAQNAGVLTFTLAPDEVKAIDQAALAWRK